MPWRLKTRSLEIGGRPLLMGIVNATPDSFSDGGACLDPAAAAERALALEADGADLVDVGGESTRPGSAGVPGDEERRRVLPVVSRLAGRLRVPISVDTAKAAVAEAALDAGAEIVNDVTALRGDPRMAAACARAGCGVVLMHMQGEPRTMQADPRYGDVVAEIAAFLRARLAAAAAAGIARDRIAIDPGIGFGKTLAHNLEILRRLPELASLGAPVLAGPSRKRFLGELTGIENPADRDGATAAACVFLAGRGASILRVHNVALVRQALEAWRGMAGPEG